MRFSALMSSDTIFLYTAGRVREYAEHQWARLRDECPRDKAVFLQALKEITDK
jgi:hypothetical protein